MGSLNRGVDVMDIHVDQPVVLRVTRRVCLVLAEPMKSSPHPAITLAVAQEHYLFRCDLGNALRIKNIDKFVVSLAVYKGVEKAGSGWSIDIRKRPQFTIIPKALSYEFLVFTKQIAGATCLRAAAAHRCVWRTLHVVESLIGKSQNKTTKLPGERWLIDEEFQAISLYIRGRRDHQLAVADEHRTSVAIFDWRQEIDLAAKQGKLATFSLQHKVIHRSVSA